MKLRDEDDLNLPNPTEAPGEPPKIPFPELIKQCESMLPHWNKIRYSRPEPPRSKEAFVLDESLREDPVEDKRRQS